MHLPKNFRKPAAGGFLAVGLLSVFSGSVKADQLAYLLSNGSAGPYQFGTVDLNTGAFSQRGAISGTFVTGLGVAGGTLYTEGGGGFTLESINTSNGALTSIGNGAGVSLFGSTTTGLYGINSTSQDLYSINPLTGATTVIGSTGLTLGVTGTALSTNSSTLYYAWNGALYTVDTATGAATLLGNNLSQTPYALLSEGGSLYAGVDYCPNSSPVGCSISIDTVNSATGALTQGATSNTNGVLGLAPDPLSGPVTVTGTPEPATWSVVAIVLVALAFERRRRASLSDISSEPR